MTTLWQTYEAREALLKQLVQHDTVTNSPGELTFPTLVKSLISKLPYFQDHRDQLLLAQTEDDKEAVFAFYKAAGSSKKTIVLISHFDTVGVNDYAQFKPYATDPDQLREVFMENDQYLTEDAKRDLVNGEYLFGRGAMDMKAGLMLHLSLMEQAINEAWDVNLILVTVPDEEVNSSGMRKAVQVIDDIRASHDLDIQLHLNSEPTFKQGEKDEQHYVYSGSIGKIMPGVLCYGRETHVGNPLSGLSSNYMMSYINQVMEYNTRFKETFKGEASPVPVSIMNKDLKENYDVQTPFRSLALYNLFLFKKSPKDVYRLFIDEVVRAVERCEQDWLRILETEDFEFDERINVLSFEQLKQYAIEHHGREFVEDLIEDTLASTDELHLQNVRVVDRLIEYCRFITPAVVTFFAAPYYPAVNSSDDPYVQSLVTTVKETLRSEFNRNSEQVHFFNGISDSSYAQSNGQSEDFETYEHNTPNFNKTYHIPFETIQRISAPVLLCGPIGKEAHSVGERVHRDSAFKELPIVLEQLVKRHFLGEE